jgi:serine phosphatase RsbU (regulator of sigma subunit)/PAS domain-containing protein/anti-sigma regulatory factor (Ser/Thr protein kinase)
MEIAIDAPCEERVMDASAGAPSDQGFSLPAFATAIVDRAGTITGWSEGAARLLDRPANTTIGRPFTEVLTSGEEGALLSVGVPSREPRHIRLRQADGADVEAILWTEAMGPEASSWLIHFLRADLAVEWSSGISLLRALLKQDQIGIAVCDTDLKLKSSNIAPGMFGASAVDHGGRLSDLMWGREAPEAESMLREVLRTGIPVISHEYRQGSTHTPPQDCTVSLSAFRLQDARDVSSGLAVVVEDVTEQERIHRQRELLHSAANRIGFSLDVRRTSQALADVVHEVCDLVTVDLTLPVLTGDQLDTIVRGGDSEMVRATAVTQGNWPENMINVGGTLPVLPDSPQLQEVLRGRPIVVTRQEVIRSLREDERLISLLVPEDAHSLVLSPLFARGFMLGTLGGWRTGQSPVFNDEEVQLLGEISSRAALGIDNARRYAYEHRTALALQERLLPRAVTDLTGAHTVGVYSPAGGDMGPERSGSGAAVGGDWFDVIALPSLRVAFVVGDVVGHGLPAAAGMGRLRTAVQNFALLEMEPAEVLTHMEDLVQRLAEETSTSHSDTTGATCMFGVYDPTTRQCSFANAGQPAPLFVRPDGSTEQLDVPPGPPLGVGSVPYQSTTVTLQPSGTLALFTDGLLELDPYAGLDGVHRLSQRLAELCGEEHSLERIGDKLLGITNRPEHRDDIAVLLAEIHSVDPSYVASREFPSQVSSVAEARTFVAHQIEAWDLSELAFTTELIVSELVTNAIRYSWAPIRVRLIRDDVLICEVSDPSNTQPRLVRARSTDEGGRGLFIVAQCTTRWGARYANQGKTIWTEQPLRGDVNPLITFPDR